MAAHGHTSSNILEANDSFDEGEFLEYWINLDFLIVLMMKNISRISCVYHPKIKTPTIIEPDVHILQKIFEPVTAYPIPS